MSLKRMPKGYAEDHPAISYLKLQSLIAEQKIADEDLTKATLHKKALNAFQALQPLLDFINRSLEGE
jgi:uncharacterized protein (DUF2461 family)